MIPFRKQTTESEQKVCNEEDTNTILTELLKDQEKKEIKMIIADMENRSSHFNLHFHGFPESFGTLETESFLRKVLPGMLG